jgi:hypothetical protein
MDIKLFFQFFLFGNVSWTTNMRLYGRWKVINYIYYMYINFILFFSYNHWMKINFDSKWTLSSKMLSCKFLSFLFVFMIVEDYHQNFNLLHTIILVIHYFFLVNSGSPLVCSQTRMNQLNFFPTKKLITYYLLKPTYLSI